MPVPVKYKDVVFTQYSQGIEGSSLDLSSLDPSYSMERGRPDDPIKPRYLVLTLPLE